MKSLIILLPFFLSACSAIQTGNNVFDAIYSGTSAVIDSKGASSKCEQGHAQDRVNCLKRKQTQVDAIDKSLKKNSNK
ncbi:hypothetical protein H4J46_15120 [Colwellia sp. MB02u-6]|uniref:hypothetical protein n=1 Tax=Colwellia sp. MB02u-6 TaxID=2759824 RepID=UPI0015F691C9|nr:hypothetical protein [Colwellia sp. MB02u-6]MBA6329257.1 hypothetical protein [Colwellia sp. MB02u-6]